MAISIKQPSHPLRRRRLCNLNSGSVRRTVVLAFILLEVSAAGMRSAKVTANAFRAGFQRMVHRAAPVPLGSMPRVTRYRVFKAACWVGKWPLTVTARR